MLQKLKTIFFKNTTLKATVFKNFMWLATSNVTSRVIKGVLTVYAARVLGAAGYGVVSYALGLAGFFIFIKNIGVDVILTREVAKQPHEEHFYFSTATVIELALLVLTAALLLFVAPIFSTIPAAVMLLPYIAIMIIADDIRDIFVAFFRGKEQMEVEALVVVVGNVAVAIFGFIALFASPTPVALVMAYAGASLAGVFAAAIFVKGFLVDLHKNFKKNLVRPILRSSLPIVFAGLTGMFMYNVDIIMLGWWRSPEEIGWYSAAQRIVGITSIFSGFIATATFPALSRLVQEGASDRLKELAHHLVKLNFMIAIPIVVGGVVLGAPLTHLFFGSAYASAAVPLAIYVFSLLANYQVPLLTTLVYAFDKQVSVVWFGGAVSVVNIVLSYFLIQTYGMIGAAIAGVVIAFLFMGLLWRRVAGLVSLRVPREVWSFLFAASGMGIFAWLCMSLGINVLIIVFAAGILYLGILELLGEHLRAEVRSLFSA